MQNNIRKAFVAALLAVAAFGVSLAAPGGAAPGMPRPPGAHPDGVATATSVKTTTARLGSLRRDDTVVVAVEGVIADPGVDTNAVRAIVEEYCGTNIVPRVYAVESGLSDVEEWQRTNAVTRSELHDAVTAIDGRIGELALSVDESGRELARLLSGKADRVVRSYALDPPHADISDVWSVDVDGTVLRCAGQDAVSGIVTWVGTNVCNSLWVSGSTDGPPPVVEYTAREMATDSQRQFTSFAVRDVATGDLCGVPVPQGDGVAVVYPAEDYTHFGDGVLQYMYAMSAIPAGSCVVVFYEPSGGAATNVARLYRGCLRDVESHVVYDTELAPQLAGLRDSFVSRAAATSGFTEWVVVPARPLGAEVVVDALPAADPAAVYRDWSLFYADDSVRDDSTRLAAVKHMRADGTGLSWTASETSWGVPVTASRARIPTMTDISGVRSDMAAYQRGTDSALRWLTHYATNNYTSAYLANKRAKDLEAWQYTNAVGRADIERGMTDWAVTPMWPVGYVDVGQILDGASAGMWSLFPTGVVHSAENALLPGISGVMGRTGDVVGLLWPGVSWPVAAQWTNSLDVVGIPWDGLSNGYVMAHIDVRAVRSRVVTVDDVANVATNLAYLSTNRVAGIETRLDQAVGDLAGVVRFSLPPACFPIMYGPSGVVSFVSNAAGVALCEEGDVIGLYDVMSGRRVCSFDAGTLKFRGSPYADSLLFKAMPAVSNEWPVLSVSVRGTPVVPAARTVNGKALSSDVTLTASDVGVGMEESSDGQTIFLTVDGAEVPVQRALPFSYSDGVLREQAELSIRTDAGDRAAWENAVADIWLSSFDGDDANDGLSPAGAVRTIAGAYNAAYTAVTNGTLDAAYEVVVAVAEGVYAPVALTSALTNGIAFVATGDREDTIVDGMLAWSDVSYAWAPYGRRGVRLTCRNGVGCDPYGFDFVAPFSMTGFTITRFNYLYDAEEYGDMGRCALHGITFKRCDITGNCPMPRYGTFSGRFVDCDIHGNRVLPYRNNTTVYALFGGWANYRCEGANMLRCHVWDNDISPCEYFMYGGSTYDSHANNCLFEVDFYESLAMPGGGYNTIIAKSMSNPVLRGLGVTHGKRSYFNPNSFIVVATPGEGYDESIYNPTGTSCVVSNANLTADFVAADASCPSVRGNGLPDFGYRDSGFSGVIAAGRTVDLDERITLQPAIYSDAPAFTEWEYSGLDSRFTVLSGPIYYPQYGGWYCDDVEDAAAGSSYEAYAQSDDANATNLVMGFEDEWGTNFTFTATRTRTDVTGYALGPQTNKVLASTLAVDRLWDRSTNSFLKAQWENGDSTGSRLVESGAGVDFYYRDGDWRRMSRWDWDGFRIWGDDYVELTGGDAPGLWVGADWDGNNNIRNGESIGYLNGYVALRGSGYDDYIYFPTGVGGGRDNVFALTKDIDGATNALSGAISGKVSTNDFIGATNTLSSSLSAQIDTESPLLARSYAVTQQSGWTYDRANGTSIYFRPRYFGMRDGDLFKGVVLRTKDQNLTPFPTVYMRLKRYSDGAVLGVTDAVQYPDTPNTDVVFRLPRAVTLPSSGNYYVLDFAITPDGAAITQFGMRLYNLGSTTSPDCYFQVSTLVPVMTAQFYSWASVVAPSAAAEEGQLADAKATGEALAGKASEAEAEALRTAMNDKMDKIESVGRTNTFLSVDEGGTAEESGYGPWDFSGNWVSGASYKQYDVVRYDGSFYYAKSDINDSTVLPSFDPTWGSLANLAALAHQFLPLTGGTMTGDITVATGDIGRDAITTVTIGGRKYGALECEAGGISYFGEIISCAQGFSSIYAKSSDLDDKIAGNDPNLVGGLDSSVAAGKSRQIALGYYATATKDAAVAIGGRRYAGSGNTQATGDGATAIGAGASASGNDACQIGYGTNSVAQSLKFRGTVLVDGNGKIPSANLDVAVATRISSPTTGNFVAMDADGNLVNSGVSPSVFARTDDAELTFTHGITVEESGASAMAGPILGGQTRYVTLNADNMRFCPMSPGPAVYTYGFPRADGVLVLDGQVALSGVEEVNGGTTNVVAYRLGPDSEGNPNRDKLLQPAVTRAYALFLVDCNYDEGETTYTGFELKASTNNFDHAVEEDVRLQFYAQSEIADTGRSRQEAQALGKTAMDRMKLFACTSVDSQDVRSWTAVSNTLSWAGQPQRFAVLVDVSCLERHKEDNGAWLCEGNEDIVWSYCRTRRLDPAFEKEPGTSQTLWRTIQPVRWYSRLPNWAAGN